MHVHKQWIQGSFSFPPTKSQGRRVVPTVQGVVPSVLLGMYPAFLPIDFPQCLSIQWSPLKRTLLGPPLAVHNMEVSVFQGLPIYFWWMIMCNQAGEHNEAISSDLSIAL